ncbi:MAG: methylated-DNA--[Solobacterium sp.]|nr:methylated-DNA--[protein]-cysteine S-methyltransferase [Solobacterium sp.]
MDYIHYYNSPLGRITLASDSKNLTGLWFNHQKNYGSTLSKDFLQEDLLIFKDVTLWLDEYFSGMIPTFLPSLKYSSTPFRNEVWKILLTIPYGKTMTYGEIAKTFSKTMSAQAIGGAVGHNPISIIIPCHRVIGKDRNLVGYDAGIETKRELLRLEDSI